MIGRNRHQRHKRHFHNDVCNVQQYTLDCLHMGDLLSIDLLRKHHQGMDFQANQVDIYMLDPHELLCRQLLDRKNSHYILQWRRTVIETIETLQISSFENSKKNK